MYRFLRGVWGVWLVPLVSYEKDDGTRFCDLMFKKSCIGSNVLFE